MQSTKWELYEYQRSRSVIDLGPNHLHSISLNFFSSITADFNISSAIRWAIQDQWSSGLHLAEIFFSHLWRCLHHIRFLHLHIHVPRNALILDTFALCTICCLNKELIDFLCFVEYTISAPIINYTYHVHYPLTSFYVRLLAISCLIYFAVILTIFLLKTPTWQYIWC